MLRGFLAVGEAAGHPEADRAALLAAAGGYAPHGARLWGSPGPAVEGPPRQPSPELLALVRQLSTDAKRNEGPRGMANLAVTQLLAGHAASAVATLEAAAGAAPADAVVWNDLAVARLVLAEEGASAVDLVEALAAVERAAAAVPGLPEARFNRALVYSRLELRDLAAGEWREVLDHEEPGSPWTAAAREHLAGLARATERQQWAEVVARLRPAAPPEMARQLAGLLQPARLHVEETTLPAWGRAVLAGADASAPLELAGAISRGLAAAGGDPLLARSVAVIEAAAAAPGRQRLEALARGHVAYADGMAFYREARDVDARDRFSAAAAALASAGSPFAGWARFRAALCRYYAGANEEVLADLAELAAAAGDSPALQGRALLLAGMASYRLAHLDRSASHYRQALAHFTTIGEREHVVAAHFMLAEALQAQGNLEAAWGERLRALRSASGLDDSIYYYNTLFDAAEALRVARRHELALVFETAKVSFARRDEDPLLLTEALVGRARTRQQLADRDGARADLAEAGAWLAGVPAGERRLRLDTAIRLARAEAAAGTPEARTALTAALALAREREDHFRLPRLYLLRAESHLAAGAEEAAAADLLAAIEETESQRSRSLDEQVAGAYLDDRQEAFDAMTELLLRRGEPWEALAVAERGRTRNLLESLAGARGADAAMPPAPTREALAEALPEGTALVELAVLRDRTVAWVVGGGTGEVRELAVGAAEVERRVAALRGALESGRDRVPAEAAELFDLLIAPLADLLAPYRSLVVVPDEALHALPFALLRDRRDAVYLVERWAVVTVPSAALYLRAARRQPEPRPGSALVLAAPALAGTGYDYLPHLPAAREEAAAVAAAYPRATLLAGRDATRDAFRAAVDRHEVVHFAAHAAVNEARPLLSAIPLAASSSGGEAALYAHEIYRLRLEGVRLVVLGTCSGGSGRLSRSEGADSLARAFLAAGVPAVVSASWPIEDRAAAHFFAELHRRLGTGEEPAAALRATQLAMLRAADPALSRPKAWAAYQLTGAPAASAAAGPGR